MIAAVEEPWVCLNVAVQRATPFDGSAAVDADDAPEVQAVEATHERINVARVPRIVCSGLTMKRREAERGHAPLRL
jgi:hypothetical protein